MKKIIIVCFLGLFFCFSAGAKEKSKINLTNKIDLPPLWVGQIKCNPDPYGSIDKKPVIAARIDLFEKSIGVNDSMVLPESSTYVDLPHPIKVTLFDRQGKVRKSVAVKYMLESNFIGPLIVFIEGAKSDIEWDIVLPDTEAGDWVFRKFETIPVKAVEKSVVNWKQMENELFENFRKAYFLHNSFNNSEERLKFQNNFNKKAKITNKSKILHTIREYPNLISASLVATVSFPKGNSEIVQEEDNLSKLFYSMKGLSKEIRLDNSFISFWNGDFTFKDFGEFSNSKNKLLIKKGENECAILYLLLNEKNEVVGHNYHLEPNYD